MSQPLDTLKKMLTLEKEDYHFRDRAVAGGLRRYAETWQRQAGEVYGEAAASWVGEVADLLRAYSAATEAERPALFEQLWTLLRRPPQGEAVPAPSRGQRAPVRGETPSAAPAGRGGTRGPGVHASVALLPGVGPKRAELLAKLGVETIHDLLHLYPRRYDDFSRLKTIDQLNYGETVTIVGTVWEASGRRTRTGRYLFRAILSDETGTIVLTWFNQPYLEGRIKAGMQLVVRGKVDEYLGRLTLNAPEWEVLGRGDLQPAILPVYPLTEGLTQKQMRQIVRRALSSWARRLPDPLPASLREAHRLLPLSRALWGIHFPDSQEHLAEARRRLTFEEALYLQLGLLRQKLTWKAVPGRRIAPPPERLEALIAALPYELTGAQRRSLEEMLRDLASGQPMNRLLQGDVGSGKTVIAALLMAVVAGEGYQAAMMAPTEILAEQHAKSVARLFERFPEPRPRLRLLTGSTPAAEKEAIYAALATGEVDVVVGTHALIQGGVTFHDLALAVIDEQHRFGVEQRGALRQKGHNPHLLVMTATPIPRSLELTLWGHLDVSILDEMPPGRQPVETRVLSPRERERAYAFIRAQVEKGRQAFIIYPLVESSEKVEAPAAVEAYERLSREVFPDLRLGLLHGRMKADEKDAVMSAFARGELDILVATAVVEVGIDVPNATVILIEGADRFGLAQLHQFRGRVGRGEHRSYCLLLAESPSEEARERLSVMERTSDGFELAQKDLEMRGPGEFLGTRQSGFPELPLLNLLDTRTLHEVRSVAEAILEADPELSDEAHRGLAQQVADFWKRKGELS